MRNEVREAALRAGGHSQTPGYYDELLDSFFFRPKPATDPNVAGCERNADPEADSLSVMRRNLDPVFGACLRAMRAKPGDERLRNLFLAVAEQRAFQSALAAEAPDPASNYLAHYPSGRYAADVLRHLARLERGRGEPAVEPPEPARAERRIETTAQPPAANAPAANPSAAPAPSVAVAALATKVETAPPAIPGAPASGTAVPSPAPELAEDNREDLTRELQTELKRVGCYSGPVDGAWGARARDALLAFNRAAGAGLPADDPRPASVEAVRLQEARVCPLQCGIGRRPDADGERCVRVACRLGERLNDEGVCAARATLRRAALPAPRLARPEPRPEPVRAARPEPRPEPARAARPEPARTARPEPAPPPREKVREVSAPKPVVRSLSAAPAREEPPARRVQPRVVAEPPPAPRLVRRPPRRPVAEPRVVAEPAPARIVRRPAPVLRPAAEPQPVVVQQAPPPPAPRLGIGIGFGGGRLGIGGIGIGF
jgi:hypothetical protein